MNKNHIFIHIPKTGGTTLNTLLYKTNWQTTVNFNYRHIQYETKCSNSTDIFTPSNKQKYKGYKIFTLLRNPADRLISEYYFIKDRPEFFELLDVKPKNFEEYIKNKQTQNYTINFLLGKPMFGKQPATKAELDMVLKAFNELPIYTGIFEHYSASLNYFEKTLGISFPKTGEAKRVTLNRPDVKTLPNKTIKLIEKLNAFDYTLYNQLKQKFENELPNLKQKTTLVKDRYNYVIKYNERFELIEPYLNNKTFLKNNKHFFYELKQYLHKNNTTKEGKHFTTKWNNIVLTTLIKNVTQPNLLNQLKAITPNTTDPLLTSEQIAHFLNKHQSKVKQPLVYELPKAKNKANPILRLIKKWAK